ncbi:precorrin-2 C20-methyltransferase [Devosia epidermidihirudinis]|uniref:Precorrin-2 C20-methyltransferase n=1 Tax=Devosia epidermidihirudinis TaxID=1293439 RepID=A0A0F5QKC3_9HYPH|nr:precorrin-2 C(20)-methyltransferase [Devosia epidermidihirudinis]KKC41415.1 precorrin-2 C20-methyltransferase [Devosia epidermidihirudinis]
MTGKLFGVGTGPGDPELLTLKAAKAISTADVVAYFAKQGNASNARAIVAELITGQIEEQLGYPVTTEIDRRHEDYKSATSGFYAEAAERVAAHLDAGRNVAVLSEGDPLFYGSYMHLHVRLAHRYPTEVIPGITAMSGCWSTAGLPLVQGDDILSVLPGTLDEVDLRSRLDNTDGAVIMKVGRNLPKIRRAIEAAGRLDDAVYVERGTMANGLSMRLADKPDDVAPYFALILVPGWSNRP